MKFVLITLAASIVLSNHSFADEKQNEAIREATSNLKSRIDKHEQKYGVNNKNDALRPILVTMKRVKPKKMRAMPQSRPRMPSSQ
jgi:hypothetical protein